MTKTRRTALALFCSFAFVPLAGCGKRGRLYLPEERQAGAGSTDPAPSAPAAAGEPTEDDATRAREIEEEMEGGAR